MAVNSNGDESELSNLTPNSAITTYHDKPGPVENIRFTSGDGNINVTWDKPLNHENYIHSTYAIRRYLGDSYYSIFPHSPHYYYDTNVSLGQVYTYEILVFSSDNIFGNKAVISATPYIPPSAPQNLQIISSVNSQVNLTWQAPSTNNGKVITNYTLYRDDVAIYTTNDASTFSYLDLNTTFWGIHNYTVTASNVVGEGPRSNYVLRLPNGDKPTNVVARYINYRSTLLTWDAPVNTGGFNITSYKYSVSVDSGASYEVDINLTSPVTSANLSGYHQHTGFASGLTVEYTILAVNSNGDESELSSITPNSTITTYHDQAGQVENLQYTSGDGNINVTWDKPLNDENYIQSS